MFRKLLSSIILNLLWLSFLGAQNADTIWTHTFGGSLQDVGRAISLASDDAYVIAANTGSLDGDVSSAYILKINAHGELIWEEHWDSDQNTFIRAMTRTRDNCYALTGQVGYGGFYGHPFLLKIDQDGNEVCYQEYDTGMIGNNIIETPEGNFIIVGAHLGNLTDVLIICADADGEELWNRIYDINLNEYAEDVKCHPEGGYIITGCTGTGSGDGWDIFLLKTDETGEQEWIRFYGFPGLYKDDYPGTIEPTSDGGYIIGGTTYSSNNTYSDLWLLKINAEGDTMWTSMFGGQFNDVGRCAIQTYDGGYVITGNSMSYGHGSKDVYIIKTDRFGGIFWTMAIGGYYADLGWDIIEDKDRELVLVGQTESFGAGSYDVYVIKLQSDPLGVDDVSPDVPSSCELYQNYPNPFNASTMIKYVLPRESKVTIDIYDALGRKVSTLDDDIRPAGHNQTIWHADDLPSGVYFYKLQAGNYCETRAMMLIK